MVAGAAMETGEATVPAVPVVQAEPVVLAEPVEQAVSSRLQPREQSRFWIFSDFLTGPQSLVAKAEVQAKAAMEGMVIQSEAQVETPAMQAPEARAGRL